MRLAPPPPTDEANWRRLLNLVYIAEEDALFVWLRSVREAVEEALGSREGGAA